MADVLYNSGRVDWRQPVDSFTNGAKRNEARHPCMSLRHRAQAVGVYRGGREGNV